LADNVENSVYNVGGPEIHQVKRRSHDSNDELNPDINLSIDDDDHEEHVINFY
jgi:hypothetical protein